MQPTPSELLDTQHLSAAQLQDIKDDLIKKATGFATEKINAAITAQLGAVGGAILGPVVEMGLGAILNIVGLGGSDEPSDTDKIMAELDKIKDTLQEMKGQLSRIEHGIDMLANLVVQESERINQAAKYRDYMSARDRIESMWTVLWGIVTSIAEEADNREAVVEAIDLYYRETSGFAVEIISQMKNIQAATLKMFSDNESLFQRVATISITETQNRINAGISKVWNSDGMTLLKRYKPDVWQKLEEGPCGPAIKDPVKYPDKNHKFLPNHWYGDNWFTYMEKVRPVIEEATHESTLMVFLAEINMLVAKATLMLTIIYRGNTGVVAALNDVVAVVNAISDDANNNEHRFAENFRAWVTNTGKWGHAPVQKHRPIPDMTVLFGHWASYFLNTTTNVLMAGTYIVGDDGKYYPCSIFWNSVDIKVIAERTWRDPSPMMMYYFVNDQGKLDFKVKSQNLGKSMPQWFKEFMDPKETPIPKAEKFKLK